MVKNFFSLRGPRIAVHSYPLFALLLALTCGAIAAPQKPNIILIMADDLGYETLGDNGTDEPVVTSFQGRKIRGGKHKMDDSGTLVPLIASRPGTIQPGTVSDEMIDFADFLPTLCEISGTPLPDDYPGDGVSFWSTLRGEPGRDKTHAYIWYTKSGNLNAGQVLARNQTRKLRRMGPGKPLRYFDTSEPFTLTPIDDDPLDATERETYEKLLSTIKKYDQIGETRRKK